MWSRQSRGAQDKEQTAQNDLKKGEVVTYSSLLRVITRLSRVVKAPLTLCFVLSRTSDQPNQVPNREISSSVLSHNHDQ
jgi:hypothetical protein